MRPWRKSGWTGALSMVRKPKNLKNIKKPKTYFLKPWRAPTSTQTFSMVSKNSFFMFFRFFLGGGFSYHGERTRPPRLSPGPHGGPFLMENLFAPMGPGLYGPMECRPETPHGLLLACGINDTSKQCQMKKQAKGRWLWGGRPNIYIYKYIPRKGNLKT